METALYREFIPNNQKFASNGEIKPYFGLTCITWINPETPLFQKLCEVQNSIRNDLKRLGVGHVFSFLEPSSFHLTICDITFGPSPCAETDAIWYCNQIRGAFSIGQKTKSISAQTRGIGLISTLTALVRFKDEEELKKVLSLERQIKQAAKVDVRKFTGHISLAYYVYPAGDQTKKIREVLQKYHDQDFGKLTITEFDLTCFTDMNTFIPLVTVKIDTGKFENHRNMDKCQFY
jgi:hypothetical protein